MRHLTRKHMVPLAVGVGVMLTTAACSFEVSSGKLDTRTFEFTEFNEIEINSAVDATIEIGDETSVEVDVDEGLADNLKVEVEDGRLIIEMEGITINDDGVPTTARITTPSLDLLEVNGASNVTVDGLDVDSFALEVSGASRIEADGRIGTLSADVSGASDVDLNDVDIDEADVDASGASSLEMESAKTVRGSVDGASSVDVADDATVAVDVSGASSID